MSRLSVKLRPAIANFAAAERGATAIEYGLIAGGIAIVVIVVIVFTIGESLENLFTTIQTWLDARS